MQVDKQNLKFEFRKTSEICNQHWASFKVLLLDHVLFQAVSIFPILALNKINNTYFRQYGLRERERERERERDKERERELCSLEQDHLGKILTWKKM